MAAIEVRNITKRFKDAFAVKNLSFSVPENKIFGLLGPNGSGKTTTINMLAGLLIPTSGQISILEMDTAESMEQIRQYLALVPQSISLYESLTVYENLEFFGGLYITDMQELTKNIDSIISTLNLTKEKNVKVSNLSGGYQRRCSIGCALIANPKILIMDEPFANIDTNTNMLVKNFLKSNRNMTIILTTHSIEEAEELCDYVLLMNKGERVLFGTPKQITKYYSKYFGEQITIEFDSTVNTYEISMHLKLAGFNIRNLNGYGNIIAFTSMDLGNTVIDVLDSLNSVKSNIVNIDIKKPTLENIFSYLMR